MRVAYFDCVGGASGDMLLGALLDAGASEATLQNVIIALGLSGCSVRTERVLRGVLSAVQVSVQAPQHETGRHASELISIIANSDLPVNVKQRAAEIVERLARVEAEIHGSSVGTVHLHELGGEDTLIDIAGVLSAMDELAIERVFVSPLPLARGFTNSLHGRIPLPAPATLNLLKDVPVCYEKDVEVELVTPTGAALLTALADGYGGFPPLRLGKVGVGAGRRDLPFPNVVRIWIGETSQSGNGWISETLMLLETNIDDANPQVYDHVIRQLFEAGALDVTLQPVQMKKNRPGVILSILCNPGDSDRLQAILFRETITLGVRRIPCERVSLPRTMETVETLFGPIHIKVAHWADIRRVMPEYEDCHRAAEEHHVPLFQVIAAAQAAYQPSNR